MDRSFAGRLGFGPVATRPPRGARQRGRTASRGAAKPTALDRTIAQAWRLPGALARALGSLWALARAHRRVRIALIAALVALPLLGGGWLWLRNSSLVAVSKVRIVGAHGVDAASIEAALTQAAKGMTTLDVQPGKLRAAVASYPVVGAIAAHASFPHTLTIDVDEQPPVAALTIGGAATAVAADGVVLGPSHVSSSLPTLPVTAPLNVGERVGSPALLGALRVLGAAPAPLAREVQAAYDGAKGLTIVLRGGVRAYFGDASSPHAKWLALARVLADPSSAGASYVDVRVPERPAAGFPPGTAPPAPNGAQGEAEAGSTSPASSESSQALAEGLSSAVGGGSSTATSSPSTSEHEQSSTSEAQAPSETSEPAAPSAGEASTSQPGG